MLSIERITPDFALCIDDDGGRIKLPADKLPHGAVENDVLAPLPDGGFRIDRAETRRRKKRGQEALSRLDAASRRESITDIMSSRRSPVSAAALAERFNVSRQVIVGDIALLRARGVGVIATPRGYLLEQKRPQPSLDDYTIACSHSGNEQLLDELYTVVDNGATVVDVTVEHPVYGQLTGLLQISSRFDADRFVEALESKNAAPLSRITDGIHLHTIRCHDPERIEYIKRRLAEKGILISE